MRQHRGNNWDDLIVKPSSSALDRGIGIALSLLVGVWAHMALQRIGQRSGFPEPHVQAPDIVTPPVQVTVPASPAGDQLSKLSAYSAFAAAVIALATALIAGGALWFAKQQLQAAATVQHEASARDAFKEYLKTAIEHPEMAEARFLSDDEKSKERAGYEWFVSYFLFSAEQVYVAFPGEEGWRRAIADQVCYHKTYLRSQDFQTRVKLHYDEGFAKLIDDSLRDNCK